MFDNILLEQEQIDLLFALIESLASVPREKRIKFGGAQTSLGTAIIFHAAIPGQNRTALPSDIEVLHHAGLVNMNYTGPSNFNFDITPLGRKYYEFYRGKTGQPSERIENQSKIHVTTDKFRSTYPLAFEKWSKADSRLWASESHGELSVIGHL